MSVYSRKGDLVGRPRKWANEAERKAAQRGSKTAPEEPAKTAPPAPGQAPVAGADEESLEELFAGGNGAPRAQELPDAGAGEKVPAPGTGGEKVPDAGTGLASRPAPPVEEYVAGELAITRAQLELRPDLDDHAGRLERTEKYARWRHAGYLAGEVSSL